MVEEVIILVLKVVFSLLLIGATIAIFGEMIAMARGQAPRRAERPDEQS